MLVFYPKPTNTIFLGCTRYPIGKQSTWESRRNPMVVRERQFGRFGSNCPVPFFLPCVNYWDSAIGGKGKGVEGREMSHTILLSPVMTWHTSDAALQALNRLRYVAGTRFFRRPLAMTKLSLADIPSSDKRRAGKKCKLGGSLHKGARVRS